MRPPQPTSLDSVIRELQVRVARLERARPSLESQAPGSYLDDLTDVDTAGVSDGEVLSFDGTAGLWVPAAVAGATPISVWTGETELVIGDSGTLESITFDEIGAGGNVTFDGTDTWTTDSAGLYSITWDTGMAPTAGVLTNPRVIMDVSGGSAWDGFSFSFVVLSAGNGSGGSIAAVIPLGSGVTIAFRGIGTVTASGDWRIFAGDPIAIAYLG